MCINNRIQQLQQQKQELDAKIARLEQFSSASSAVRSLLENLIKEYHPIAPEELNNFLGELAMTLSANETDEFDDDDPLGTRESVEAEFCDEPSAEDIALVEQYRELNNPIPQEAAEAIKSALDENKFGFLPDPVIENLLKDEGEQEESRDEEAKSREIENMLVWGFTLWDEEQLKAFGEPNPDDFVGNHKDWEIYFSIPNGGVVGIQLKSPHGDWYDRSTEIDEEYGFPEDLSLDNFEGILTWTKQVLDNIEYAIYPNRYFTKHNDISAKPENFDSGTEKPKPDEFTEFIKLTNSVAYLKRRDNGQILSGYLGFSNKTKTGDRTQTMASNRARKWAESLEGDYQAKCEIRKPKRMESNNPAMPFAYEVKIVGLSIGQLQKLAEENFNLLPYEEEEKQEKTEITPQPNWSVTINGYSFKTGSEFEMKAVFGDSISKAQEGATMAIALWKGTETIEDYRFGDCQFKKAGDFDELAPEYWVCWKEQIIDIRVWSTLRQTAGTTAGTTERLWRHNYLQAGEELAASSKFSAAIHAVRRKLGFA